MSQWTSSFPQTGYVLIYVLSLALGFAVGIMLMWHLYLISRAESTVENHDHTRYEQISSSRGTVSLLFLFILVPCAHLPFLGRNSSTRTT